MLKIRRGTWSMMTPDFIKATAYGCPPFYSSIFHSQLVSKHMVPTGIATAFQFKILYIAIKPFLHLAHVFLHM